MTTGLSHRRAIIVGAGQSGLAVAAALMAEGLRPQQDFVVMDAARPTERSWSTRWHSMLLLSDARHSALASFPHAGDQRRRLRADEMNDYLAGLEARLGIETRWGIPATGVERHGTGATLSLTTAEGSVQTRNVICATGAASRPQIPSWATNLTVPGVRLHSAEYLYPRQIPDGEVLIVGGGNSGAQLARELCESHSVTLAVRSNRARRSIGRYPRSAGGRPPIRSSPARLEPLFGDSAADLSRAGVTVVPAVTGANGAQVELADGSQLSPHSVIFATGFLPADEWLPTAVADRRRRPTLTDIAGLFVCGMPSFGRRGSGTIAGVSRDASAIAHHVINRP
ncbi:NAD(P)-binding domain-containing protein [Microbacterium sp.]|uniref:NAD(P)-binding domain-containing protein n=1 Tax=Microbacterium sp. TaxID=51671 RepID=UPI003F7312A3